MFFGPKRAKKGKNPQIDISWTIEHITYHLMVNLMLNKIFYGHSYNNQYFGQNLPICVILTGKFGPKMVNIKVFQNCAYTIPFDGRRTAKKWRKEKKAVDESLSAELRYYYKWILCWTSFTTGDFREYRYFGHKLPFYGDKIQKEA